MTALPSDMLPQPATSQRRRAFLCLDADDDDDDDDDEDDEGDGDDVFAMKLLK